MFDELRAKIAEFEGRVTGVFTKIEGTSRALRAELNTLDQAVLVPLDKVTAAIVQVRSTATGELMKIRKEISDLAPPR